MRSEIIFYAFRYALGRMTYAVSTVAEFIINNLEDLDETDKNLIVKEIKEAIDEGNAGMQCDIDQWLKVVNAIEKECERK